MLWENAPKLLAASFYTFARSHGPSEDASTARTARPIAEEALRHQGGTHALAIPPSRTSAQGFLIKRASVFEVEIPQDVGVPLEVALLGL